MCSTCGTMRKGRSYFEHTHTPCQIIAGTDELSKEPNKLLLIDLHNHQKLEDFRAAVEPKFQGRIQFVFSSNTYLEVIPAGTSKGKCPAFSVQLPEHSRWPTRWLPEIQRTICP